MEQHRALTIVFPDFNSKLNDKEDIHGERIKSLRNEFDELKLKNNLMKLHKSCTEKFISYQRQLKKVPESIITVHLPIDQNEENIASFTILDLTSLDGRVHLKIIANYRDNSKLKNVRHIKLVRSKNENGNIIFKELEIMKHY